MYYMGNLINHDWSLKVKGIWWIFLFLNGVFWSRLDLNPWHFCIFFKPHHHCSSLQKSAFEFHFSTRILFVKAFFCMYLHFMMSFANNSYFTEIEVTVLRPFIIRHWTKLFLWLLCQIVTLFWLDSSSVQHWHQMYIFGQVKKWVNDDPDIESFFYPSPVAFMQKCNLIPFFYSGRFTYCMGRIICKLISWKLISQIWAFWLANRENSFDISQSKCSNLGNQFWEIK